MLASKHTRQIQRKTDWYSSKVRLHFDRPLTREDAERLVCDPVAVSQHPFLPLIAFSKKQRRYRRSPGSKTPKASTKNRDLAYPSNRDGHIFAYYAEKLGALYESELAACGLGKVVIGYRKGASNMRLAREAFVEIAERGECTVLALDIKGFFDNISHQVLKDCWMHLLGTNFLPNDHHAVFKALTKADKIDRGELMRRLGKTPSTRDSDLPKPLCSIAEFRVMRSDGASKLVQRYKETKGIPQGTPLSAMAANICMLRFDQAVQAAVLARGGSYRRYSDDILIICPPEHAAELEAAAEGALAVHAKTLHFNTDKREEARFTLPGPMVVATPPRKVAKPLQYLGFTFDGRRILLRSGTLSRYYRRMANGVRAAKVKSWLIQSGKLSSGRSVVHKRDLLASHSHLGTDNFVTGYARNAAKIMGPLGSKAIKRQLAGHVGILAKMLQRKG